MLKNCKVHNKEVWPAKSLSKPSPYFLLPNLTLSFINNIQSIENQKRKKQKKHMKTEGCNLHS